jgi:hypothetical protein
MVDVVANDDYRGGRLATAGSPTSSARARWAV